MTRLERPEWTLMWAKDGQVVAVRNERVTEKCEAGWWVLWREADLLPFSTPRLINDPWAPRKE